MKRKIEAQIAKWDQLEQRKPLVIFGARQIGKTYSILKFAKENYKDNYIYIDFDEHADVGKFFRANLEPEKLIFQLESYFERRIDEDTLIVFDEIQECRRALTSLKYFCDHEKKYRIIAAGSLLDVTLIRNKSSFPVGKIDRLEMYPLDFEEFLEAGGHQNMVDLIRKCYNDNQPMEEVLHQKALSLYRIYLTIGGMPEAVDTYLRTNSIIAAVAKVENIYKDYLNDIEKYARIFEIAKIRNTYLSIVKQLERNNRSFRFSEIETADQIKRSGQYYDAPIHWLLSAKVIMKSQLLKSIDLPLIAHTGNQFRLFLSDVGLLRYLSGVSLKDSLDPDYKDTIIGRVAENYVAQEFIASGLDLYYWRGKGDCEIDFIVKCQEGIIPIEVKSGLRVVSPSFKIYRQQYKPQLMILVSQKNFGLGDGVKVLPLYAVFCLTQQIIKYQKEL